jgi:secreted PhoX family phosphatase
MTRTRREVIGAAAGGVAAVALGAKFWDDLFGSASSASLRPGPGYGPRRPPDELGLRLPEGFRARVVARGGDRVTGTGYEWHEASDGAATFPVEDGGWILVSNSETLQGGASAVRFRRDGRVADAYRILGGTSHNCSGGGTPWGTWLSCEEVEGGIVWECDPTGRRDPVRHPAMGVFKHEAAAVDPRGRRVYLTEDLVDGGFYRFTPERWPSLGRGLLEIATVSSGGSVSWTEVPDPSARRTPTRRQLPGSTPLKRGEGIWRDGRTVYVATTADDRVHAYDIDRERMRVIYDGLATRDAPLLRVDQLTANRAGEVFVCEDIATKEIDIGLIERSGRVSRFLSVTGPQHANSELTGVTFDPSGGRMYFSSQRAGGSGGLPGLGAIYEISGPFRGRRTSHAFHSSAQST